MVVLMILNAVSFLLFGVDKMMAKRGMRRIPEKVLIGSALCFGGPGALGAMCLFRHKTKKSGFTLLVPLVSILQAGLVIWICQYFQVTPH